MPKDLALIITDAQIEEIKALFVEGEFNARMELVQTYHKVGELLQGVKGENLQDVAKKIGRSYRTLKYCISFYGKFPDLNMLPEGKNISMNKIIRKYLTTPEEQKAHVCTFITICSVCHEPMDLEKAREVASSGA
jgi:hypothetical protein